MCADRSTAASVARLPPTRTAVGAGRSRLASLDWVRVALALAVLLYHLGGTIALPKYFGYSGFATVFGSGGARVPFFFVLSGFLLAHLHAREVSQPARLWSFMRRRLLRIYPTYWIILLLVMGATLLTPELRGKVPADPTVLAKTFLLVTQDREVGGPTGAPLIIVAWTLHFEIAFYALVAAFICSRRLGTLCLLGLAFNAWDCGDGGCGVYREFLANPYLTHFGIGAGAALLVRNLPPLGHARLLAAVAVAAYAFLATYGLLWPSAANHVDIRSMADPNIYFALLAAVTLVCLVNAESARPPRPTPVAVKRLADASYVLYLVHFPLISVCCRLLRAAGLPQGPAGATVALLLVGLGCIAFALAFHRWVEKPLLARLR